MHSDFAVLLAASLSITLTSVYLWFEKKKYPQNTTDDIHIFWLNIGLIFFYALIWVSAHSGNIIEAAGTFMALTVYTIIGLGFYLYGRSKQNKAYMLHGGLLLAVVIIRLLFVEVWDMTLGARIVTFFVVGILLISTAFIARGKKDTINTNIPNNHIQ